MIQKTVLGFLICFSFLVVEAQYDDGWQFMYSKDDLSVYLKESSGSPIKEVRIKTRVRSSLSGIVALFQDIEAIPQWVYSSSDAFGIKRMNAKDNYYYTRLDFPWPMSDRDMVIFSQFTQDKKTKVLTSHAVGVPHMIAKKPDCVRIKDLEILWTITPQEENWIKIEYELRSNPGGSIPAWLVNLAIDRGPVQTIKGFKKLLRKDKYQNIHLPFILEP